MILTTLRCSIYVKSYTIHLFVTGLIHFQVLDKNPVSGPGRGPFFLQQM